MKNLFVSLADFNLNNILFISSPSSKEIKIGYNYGTQIADLQLESPRNLLCHGLTENIANNKNLVGYYLPIVFHQNQEQDQFIGIIESIIQKFKDYIISFGLHSKEMNLDKLNPFVYKKNTYHKDEYTPILYLKCSFDRLKKNILTKFINEQESKMVNPYMCLNKRMNVKTCIHVDCIKIGDKILMNLEATECRFKLLFTSPKRSLLCPLISI